jgi:CPA1 family monovalent cation:H+ antiporter
MIGNHGRALAMYQTTHRHIDLLWDLLDEILNAVLFVLIGMEVMVVNFVDGIFGAGAAAVAITLMARSLTAGLPVTLLRGVFRLPKGDVTVLTCGGLRGGISVALALSLPAAPERDILLALTYCVVVFFILVQGLSIGKRVKRVVRAWRANPEQT